MLSMRRVLSKASKRSMPMARIQLPRAFSTASPKIIYTMTDEAPALATYSFLPIIRAFAGNVGVQVDLSDISVAARVIAAFPERLTEEQRVPDNLAELGNICKTSEANIIKLPNISASVPQLKAAVAELQGKGYNLPDYPEVANTPEELEIQNTYKKVMGSAVNPVLREGNSDRRAPPAVKEYARQFPHSMDAWTAERKSHVPSMNGGDFYSNEQSVVSDKAQTVRIEFVGKDGSVETKKEVALEAGEILDSTFMSVKALNSFLDEQIADAKEQGILFSLHMKATMMKVSDPIIFGHCVNRFFKELFAKHGPVFEGLGVDVRNGFGDLVEKIQTLPEAQRKEIEADIQSCYDNGPSLAMVNSHKGITNLHVPSDVIIDASMPAMLRAGGQMWNLDDKLQDTSCVVPDRSYGPIYEEVMKYCKANGAFDPRTMGSVPNVGLMAQKAEEYGSHDKTFECSAAGTMRVVDADGNVLMSHEVEGGDIWRACQTKDAPIKDWVKLCVNRTRATGNPAVFWLDADRAHDANLIAKANEYLKEHDTTGMEIHIMKPADACRFSLERMGKSLDTISVTGNVLRDYLTDLFPILEVGTSAKMLSIVPLMEGGGLFETGAGGSAPKHVQQFEKEGHLRWDSLGEFLALAVSFEHIAHNYSNAQAKILGDTLNDAITKFLLNAKSPSRKVNEIDNRGSQFYLAMYWAEAVSKQTADPEFAARFQIVADQLAENEEKINSELLAAQGSPVDVGGYFYPDFDLATKAMRASATFNTIIDNASA